MSAEPVETLVERVRRLRAEGKGVQADVAMDAALTELAERLSRAEDAERLADQRYFEAIERLEAQGRKLSCGYDTGTGQNCGECLDCLKVNWHFAQEAVTNLRERLEAAELKVKQADKAYDAIRVHNAARMNLIDELQARVAALEEALRAAQALQPNRVQWFRDNGIVFHRAPLSEPPEEDGERWEQIAFSIYTDLCEVESIARAALRVEGDA